MDNAPEQTIHNTKLQEFYGEKKIKPGTTEPHSPWHNKCENIIGVIKPKAKARHFRRTVSKKL